MSLRHSSYQRRDAVCLSRALAIFLLPPHALRERASARAKVIELRGKETDRLAAILLVAPQNHHTRHYDITLPASRKLMSDHARNRFITHE